jgi:hypothetical protein
MSILRISRTISRIRSKPRFLPAKSLHAAPIQKRVLPFSFALRAASSTGSTSRRREALVAVVYLDDCEQYEPGEHEYGPAWRLWADLTVFATPPSCKPDLEFFFILPKSLSSVLLTFDIHQRTKLYFSWVVVLPMHAR